MDEFKKFIGNLVSAYHKKVYGKGPSSTKVLIIDNCLFIYCKGFLTTIETENLKIDYSKATIDRIISFRRDISKSKRAGMQLGLEDIFQSKISEIFIDYNIQNDTNAFICLFTDPIDKIEVGEQKIADLIKKYIV